MFAVVSIPCQLWCEPACDKILQYSQLEQYWHGLCLLWYRTEHYNVINIYKAEKLQRHCWLEPGSDHSAKPWAGNPELHSYRAYSAHFMATLLFRVSSHPRQLPRSIPTCPYYWHRQSHVSHSPFNTWFQPALNTDASSSQPCSEAIIAPSTVTGSTTLTIAASIHYPILVPNARRWGSCQHQRSSSTPSIGVLGTSHITELPLSMFMPF